MKIVGIAACTSGIAHTYIAKEKLLKAAQSLGHEIHIETQGTIGTEDELTSADIKAADVVIIAADINVGGKERFDGKKVVSVPTHVVIKSPKGLLNKIESDLGLAK
ncbi:PTS fructose transporter subunit IIB [Terrisporobacter sp.]|uniref:PTS fructose transporter subunit IIB n=1 Tax=Terrisporobacter sp. TaxID=1965305 RepID=UPI00260B0A29|nr:PTS fructose transporter subunit IIB [Terrisporobacter sp.]